MKPFRSPLIARGPSARSFELADPIEPPLKRRRTSNDSNESIKLKHPLAALRAAERLAQPREPLRPVESTSLKANGRVDTSQGMESHYVVLWYCAHSGPSRLNSDVPTRRKYSAKVHKTWDGDGHLHVHTGFAYLHDESGKNMGRAACDSPLLPGSTLSIGGKEVEVASVMSKQEYSSKRSHLKATELRPSTPKPIIAPVKVRNLPTAESQKSLERASSEERPRRSMEQSSRAMREAWKNPLRSDAIVPKLAMNTAVPRHDPCAAGAIVMKRPRSVPIGKQIVDVVVDPLLSDKLREHQREGVKFMYECVMGLRDFDGHGAILADEMGLGKSLQTIALLWTLLRQNPIADAPPVVKKALIVCPVTLVNNWRKEIFKWLGRERVGVFVADGTKKRITDFTLGRSYNIMIIGYEKLRNIQEDLKKGPGIDIVIIDEGHRLKTAKNKSAQAIKSLNTPRRIVLSGTPIQNDLSEFYIMVDFINPDLLGSFKRFTKEFEVPIMKSRQPGATEVDLEKGEVRNEELISLTNQFILRRTAEVLSGYLPPKTEYVLFCRPTLSQATLYHHILAHPAFQAAMGNTECALQLITVLKKACNSPTLLDPRLRSKASADTTMIPSALTTSLLETIPPHLLRTNASSTKLRVLDQLLHTIRTTTSEKVVLVSNYTSTLDVLSQLLTSLSHPFLRLDGSTPSSKRQDLVDAFNRSPVSSSFAFLLSAKAGGVGLNLTGASRLVLFDVDWNPATDLQAMARIHRDGQKRPCYIYRFMMKGAIDEKIWQRQVTKMGLASSVMDQGKGKDGHGTASFSREELRDLFRLDEGTGCQTHELLGCRCGGRGAPPPPRGSKNTHDDDDAPPPDFQNIDDLDDDDDDDDDSVGSKADHREAPPPTTTKTTTTTTTIQDSDSDSDFPSPSRLAPTSARTTPFRPASTVDMTAQEADIAASRQGQHSRDPERKNEKMQHLMSYTHIDVGKFVGSEKDEEEEEERERQRKRERYDDDGVGGVKGLRALVEDEVLVKVLKDEECRVGFVWGKRFI